MRRLRWFRAVSKLSWSWTVSATTRSAQLVHHDMAFDAATETACMHVFLRWDIHIKLSTTVSPSTIISATIEVPRKKKKHVQIIIRSWHHCSMAMHFLFILVRFYYAYSAGRGTTWWTDTRSWSVSCGAAQIVWHAVSLSHHCIGDIIILSSTVLLIVVVVVWSTRNIFPRTSAFTCWIVSRSSRVFIIHEICCRKALLQADGIIVADGLCSSLRRSSSFSRQKVVDTGRCHFVFLTPVLHVGISSEGRFLSKQSKRMVHFLKRGIQAEDPFYRGRSGGDFSAKLARWKSETSSESDELDLYSGPFFVLAKICMWAEERRCEKWCAQFF